MDVTRNEAGMLNAIARHQMNFGNGAKPEQASDVSTFCWVDDFVGDVLIETLTVNAGKGVLGSLTKKDLIHIQDWGDGDTVVGFTEAGFEVWCSLDHYGSFETNPKVKGLYDSLSSKQKRDAVSYDGPVTSGRSDLPKIKGAGYE